MTTTAPTPRILDNRPSTIETTTAGLLRAFRSELIQLGVPGHAADELVMAAGRTVVRFHGLTVAMPGILPTSPLVFVHLPSGAPGSGICRCARTCSTEGR
ncbi:hypothetical protein ACWC5I_25705 [Kitasatospora sp. NPDC001574]